MKKIVGFGLVMIILLTSSGCIWWHERGERDERGGYGEHERDGRGEHDRGGYDGGGRDRGGYDGGDRH